MRAQGSSGTTHVGSELPRVGDELRLKGDIAASYRFQAATVRGRKVPPSGEASQSGPRPGPVLPLPPLCPCVFPHRPRTPTCVSCPELGNDLTCLCLSHR